LSTANIFDYVLRTTLELPLF
jgi:succinate-semialdehyde dehydrogenase/glutarate-semialdehyde dehydrogenase